MSTRERQAAYRLEAVVGTREGVTKVSLDSLVRIGRDQSCDIVLDNPLVSREHARLISEGDRLWVESYGHSVRVNQIELTLGERHAIKGGDTLSIWGFLIRIRETSVVDDSGAAAARARQRYSVLLESLHDQIIHRLDPRDVKLDDLGRERGRRQVLAAAAAELEQIPLAEEAEVCQWAAREALRVGLLSTLPRQSTDDEDIPFIKPDLYGSYEETRLELLNEMKSALQHLPERAEKLSLKEVNLSFDAAFEEQIGMLKPLLAQHLTRWLLRKEVLDLIFEYGPLTDFLGMPGITEVMVVSKDQIYIEQQGRIEETDRTFLSDRDSERIIERIVGRVGRRVDRSTPMVDARLDREAGTYPGLAAGSRVNAIIPPLALKGPCITIRRFSRRALTMESLIACGTLDHRVAAVLRACVLGRKNLMISGGTGSGKTTLLNALSSWISAEERILTIEDNAELKLQQRHVVALEARAPNVEGRGEVTIRQLVRNALRMRPDRIIVGECRGREALDMLQAMNTGHEGSMTTAHANSPVDLLHRLEVMVLEAETLPLTAIRRQIASALDLIIQQKRLRNGSRRIVQVTEVVGFDAESEQVILEDVFRRRDSDLALTGYFPAFLDDLISRGMLSLEELFG